MKKNASLLYFLAVYLTAAVEFIQATMWPNFHCRLWSEELKDGTCHMASLRLVAKCLFYKPLGVDSAQSKAHNTHVESFLKSKVEHHRKLFPRKIIVFLHSCLGWSQEKLTFFSTRLVGCPELLTDKNQTKVAKSLPVKKRKYKILSSWTFTFRLHIFLILLPSLFINSTIFQSGLGYHLMNLAWDFLLGL